MMRKARRSDKRTIHERVSLAEASTRLRAYAKQHGHGPYTAAQLADIIWPDHHMSPQGAGGAAVRLIGRMGRSIPAWHKEGWLI